MKYQQIQLLIERFGAFEAETGKQSIEDFAKWTLAQTPPQRVSNGANPQQAVLIQGRIMEDMGRITSFVKHYVRKAIKDSPLAGWNDMVAIIGLFYAGSQRKTELIQAGLMELSPGMEVIRRLLRLELITAFPDPDDGRAKRVKLTRTGEDMFHQIERELQKVGQIIAGNLSLSELQQFASQLQKLNHFHSPIWQTDQDASLDQLIQKYILPLAAK